MKRSFFLALALACSLLLGDLPATRAATLDAIGFTNINLPAESDSYVSVPFTRPPEFVGVIQSISSSMDTMTVNDTPGWSTNQFVYAAGSQPKHYYVLIGGGGSSNPKEGHTFLVTGNGSNTLTVNTAVENLSNITPNTQVTVIPYWTLATVFPASDANVSFTPTTATGPGSYKTQIIVPNDAANGINLPPLATYYFSQNADGSSSNVGWRAVGNNTADRGDEILLPDSYFVVRNQNGAPNRTLTTLGAVLLKTMAVPLRTATGSQQDNPVSILRPLDVTLNMTGLGPTDGSFGTNDQLLVFSNSQIGFNKTPAIYYRDPARNFNWRRAGDSNLLDHGNAVIPAGTGFIVRKAATGSGATVFWTNTFPVQALSAVSRKTHNGTPFDISLPLTGTPGIEPRNPGAGYHIIVTFPTEVTFGGVTVTSGSGSATASGSGTNQATITLTGAATQQFVTVTLLSVNDGANTNDVPVTVGVLIGDANQNGSVNSGDALVTRNRSGQSADATNFRSDLNADGTINAGDATIVRTRSGQTLFPNP